MNYRLILDIAINLLRARLKQSIIAGAGVTFGVAMFIALISFMNGLNQMLDNLILNRTPHIRLYNEVKPSAEQPIQLSELYKVGTNLILSMKPKETGKQILNSKAIIHSLKLDPRVIDVAPKLSTQVFFHSGSIDIAGLINGIDVLAEDKLFKLGENIVEGDLNDLNNQHNSIIIGKGLADKMLVHIGDFIKVTTATGELATLKVVAISQFGIAEVDNTYCYTSLATAQKVIGEAQSYVTDISLKLFNIASAPAIAKEYQLMYDVDAIDIQTANAQFETGSSVRTIISYAVGVTLLIVAGFGIYNIMNMMIYEKMDSIAIMKATGFSGNDVKWIFISLSLIIGIVGGLLGLVFGGALSVLINHIPFKTAALPTVKVFPVQFSAIFYFIGISFALCTTAIAGLLPALKASKVDPVTIIRGK